MEAVRTGGGSTAGRGGGSAVGTTALTKAVSTCTAESSDGKTHREADQRASDAAYLLRLAAGSNPDESIAALHARTVLWVNDGQQYLLDQATTDVYTLGASCWEAAP